MPFECLNPIQPIFVVRKIKPFQTNLYPA